MPTQNAGSAGSRRHGPASRAAHLEVALQPHLGKDRRDVIDPVGQRRAQVAVARQLAGEQVAERQPRHVDILVLALDEIHRHVERVVDIALEAHAVLERERQHAGALVVGVAPDLRAERQEAVRLALR